MFLPCYQQDGDTCGYWCTRIAVEMLLKRKFQGDELNRFKTYKSMCSKEGVTLFKSCLQFQKYFPQLEVNFDNVESQVGKFSSDHIIEQLDQPNTVCLLNMQNMDFKGKTFKECSKGGGHNVCCYGYNDTNFLIQDSNQYPVSRKNNKPIYKCEKTLARTLVDTGYNQYVDAARDLYKNLEILEKLNKSVFHVSEVVAVYLGEAREQPPTVRTSSRLKTKSLKL
jgi:hypothetical protein